MKFNVLSSTFEGTDEPAYYNSRVGGKFYRPVESYQDPEYRKKLSKTVKKGMEDPEVRKIIKESNKRRVKDPEFLKKISNSLKKATSNHKRDPVTGRYTKKNVQAK
jgi:hypothetical protein